MNSIKQGLAAALLAATIGCGGSGSGGPDLDAMSGALDAQVDSAKATAAAEEAAKEQALVDSAAERARQLAAEGPTAVTTDDMKRGQKLKGGGYLSTSIRAGIVGQQKLNMATVTHALNLFWGLEGRYPNSHEEFMEKVVEANGLVLEPLQEPYEYWYSAEDHELYKRVKPETLEAAEETVEDADKDAE